MMRGLIAALNEQAAHLLGAGDVRWASLLGCNHCLAPFVRRQRSRLIHIRIDMIARAFAILTLLWIGIDAYFLDAVTATKLAALRAATCLMFLAVARHASRCSEETSPIYSVLAIFCAPIVFFVAANLILSHAEKSALSLPLMTAYFYLPFIVIAGLALFPLTISESIIVFLVIISIVAIGSTNFAFTRLPEYGSGMIWLLCLIGIIAMLAGLMQLHLLLATTKQAVQDGLTHAFRREVGEEIIGRQWAFALRNKRPLSLLLIDLDDFKLVNDRFGHDEGDRVLEEIGQKLKATLRAQDTFVRWGGEELVVCLPNTSKAHAHKFLGRLMANSPCLRPDGMPQTMCMGLVSLPDDNVETLDDALALADDRMYAAKRNGKNRVDDGTGQEILCPSGVARPVAASAAE